MCGEATWRMKQRPHTSSGSWSKNYFHLVLAQGTITVFIQLLWYFRDTSYTLVTIIFAFLSPGLRIRDSKYNVFASTSYQSWLWVLIHVQIIMTFREDRWPSGRNLGHLTLARIILQDLAVALGRHSLYFIRIGSYEDDLKRLEPHVTLSCRKYT